MALLWRILLNKMLTVGMDIEDKVIVLAWVLVPKECMDLWSCFMASIKESLPAIDSPNFVLINDWEKRLLSAISNIVPCAENANGAASKLLFWNCVYTETEASFIICK